ncbi:MAG: hypothetical protein RI928_177 [Pseudomonadota bacterium]|jgi:hypothetical protein
MKRLISCVALLITMQAASAQNIFEISPDSSNPNYAQCKFQNYDDSALLITTYMGSLVAGKYEKACSAEFLTQAKEGKRKHDAMLKATDQQIGYCYSDKDMQFIRSLLITAVDKIPEFCESKNVADAIEDWVKRLNQEN